MEKNLKHELKIHANKIRQGIIEGTFNAKSGHPGGSLSAVELLTYLYFCELNVDPANPDKEGRDRFVLSKGHAAPALYSTLAERGFFSMEELKLLRKPGKMLQGHPDMNKIPGVDMSTGSLGQGVSAAVGIALAGKIDKKDYRVYAILGDGEIEEGQVWEAAMFAGNRKLDNLTVIVDNNNLQIDGTLDEVNSPYPIAEKFAAFGFETISICGHCYDEIQEAVNKAKSIKDKPVAIIAKTVKGKGVSYMENQCGWHGKAPDAEQYETAMNELKASLAEMEGK